MRLAKEQGKSLNELMGWDGTLTHPQALVWRLLLFPDEAPRRQHPQEPPIPDDEWDRQVADSRKFEALNDPNGRTKIVNIGAKDAKLVSAADLLKAGVSRKVNPVDPQAAMQAIKQQKQGDGIGQRS